MKEKTPTEPDAATRRVMAAFDRYLIAVEKGLRGTLPSGANMESTRSQKPGSRPPQSAYGERFLSHPDNAEARMCFEPALRWLQNDYPDLYATLADEVTSPGLKARLEAVSKQERHPYIAPVKHHVDKNAPGSVHLKAQYDYDEDMRAHEHRKARFAREKADAPGWLARFDGAREDVARFVLRWFHTEPRIELDPDDEPSPSPIHARNRDNNRQRSHDARDAYASIYKQWRAFEESHAGARQDVKERFCKWYEDEHAKGRISVRKLERAIAFCEDMVYSDRETYRRTG